MDNPGSSHFPEGHVDPLVNNESSTPASGPSTENNKPIEVVAAVVLPPKDAFRQGLDYEKERNLNKAERMYEQALSESETKNGLRDPTTLAIRTKLAYLYSDRGEAGKAERFFEMVLDIRNQTLGPGEELTLECVLNLATFKSEHGRLEEAEQLYRRALGGCEKTLGPNHPLTMSALNNLANLLAGQDRFGGVKDMYRRVLAFHDHENGAEEKDGLKYTTLMNLGALNLRQGNLHEAKDDLQRALEGQEKWLGPDHRLTLLNIANLGEVYTQMQEVQKAKQTFQRALEGFERTFGYDCPLAIKVSNRIEQLTQQESIRTKSPVSTDTNSNDVVEQRNDIDSGDSLDRSKCFVCGYIKKAALYTPVHIPTHVGTKLLLEYAEKGCTSCQFFEAIMRLRSPSAFARDNTNFSVSWISGREHGGSAHPNPSKIMFWVEGEEGTWDIFEIFSLTGSHSPIPWWEVGAARIPPEDTSSEASFMEAVSWLQRCRGFHGRCNQAPSSDAYLPTRVVDVDPIGPDGSVKLVEPKGESGKYLCLSYCWGDAAHILKSTRETQSQCMKEIPWSALPKTFQDAITFVRRLGHRYIWIDSLCIIHRPDYDVDIELVPRDSRKWQAIFSTSGKPMVVSVEDNAAN